MACHERLVHKNKVWHSPCFRLYRQATYLLAQLTANTVDMSPRCQQPAVILIAVLHDACLRMSFAQTHHDHVKQRNVQQWRPAKSISVSGPHRLVARALVAAMFRVGHRRRNGQCRTVMPSFMSREDGLLDGAQPFT